MKYKFTPRQYFTYFFSKFGNLFNSFYPIPKRKYGISVMIRVKNEEQWIAVSLSSLKGFADEVIIVDNGSTDHTINEILKVKSSLPFPIILRKNSSPDICQISNEALSLTSYRWIMRWDADFIAYTSGYRNIIKLRKYLLSLNQNNYYLIYPIMINFAGDLFHLQNKYELHSEGYIHTYYPALKYIKRGKFEFLKVPFFFNIKRISTIHFIHIGTAKSLDKLLYRFFWLKWLKEKDFDKYPTVNKFIEKEAKEKWDSASFESIIKKLFYGIICKLKKYDIAEFGDYPELIKQMLKNPPFRIIYKNGKPYSRSDF